MLQRALSSSSSVHVEGSVAQVIYRSAKTAYTVLEVKVGRIAVPGTSGGLRQRKVTVVGTCAALEEGSFVRAAGEWVESAKHGLQLRAASIAQITPTSAEACKRYLRNFAGVGPKRAKLLVEAFPKENVFDVLEHSPERLLEVHGIGKAAVSKLVEEWKSKRALHEAAAYLNSVGIGPAVAERLAVCLGGTSELCAAAVKENPYSVVSRSDNLLSFSLADEIGLKHLKLSADDERRVREGLVHAVSRLCWSAGHTCVEAGEAVNATMRLLNLSSKAPVLAALAAEQAGGRLPSFSNGQIVSPKPLFEAEMSVASNLKRIMKGSHPLPYVNADDIVRVAEKEFGAVGKFRLAAAQAEAVRQAMKCKVLIVTGGPGVGKTTAMSSIVSSFRRMKVETVVASPTGRAAAKLAQVTKQKATTLHRLLEYDPAIGGFKRNAQNKLVGGLFLVDEASMIDVELAASFFAAVPERAVVVLVGDVDQLPAVGPGALLHDLVQSQLPTVRLDRNFRQADETSDIVKAAHAMLRGERFPLMPYNVGSGLETFEDFVAESDLRFVSATAPDQILSGVVGVMEDLKTRFHVDPVDDIQVLTAMRKGPLGCRSFNSVLQRRFNNEHRDPLLVHDPNAAYLFRKNDKVMQVVNDYFKDVYNGEIGRVTKVEDGLVQVRFPSTNSEGDELTHRLVEYRSDEVHDLDPAFAITIHKAQGCEFPVSVIPVHGLYNSVLQRNLLYTAITRATKLTVIVGDVKAVHEAIAKTDSQGRRTRLEKMIKDKD